MATFVLPIVYTFRTFRMPILIFGLKFYDENMFKPVS